MNNTEPTQIPHNAVRRRDRAVTDDAWIRSFLHRSPVCTLATVHDGRPHVNTNIFVFDEETHRIYLHTARHGKTRDSVDASPEVCLTVHEMGRLLPAEEAVHFSLEYAGVVVDGRASIVEGEAARAGLKLLMAKYAPHLEYGGDYVAVRDKDLKRTSVYCVEIRSWAGKKKEVAPDFPGAYQFEDVRRAVS